MWRVMWVSKTGERRMHRTESNILASKFVQSLLKEGIQADNIEVFPPGQYLIPLRVPKGGL